jgi:addiction module RelE/StbE family toxin
MNAIYAPRAQRDLEAIAEYLVQRSPAGTKSVLAAIKSSAEILEAFPEIGRVVDDAGHRRLPVSRFPYVIYYRIAGNEVLILHIRHTSRRPIDPSADL